MTEVEYVVENFGRMFYPFSGSKIILHGSREYARAIIDNYDDVFHFAGIMSRDPLDGELYHGLKVMREEDIPNMDVDMIILTERVKYAEAVYQSIDQICRERDIQLYDMYGLDQRQVHADIDNCRHLFLDGWVDLCSSYDMVVFEVMDTLLFPEWYSTEAELRPVFRDLLRILEKNNKEVQFSLRKSASEQKQLESLKKIGVITEDCDKIIRRRGEDLSFRMLRENHPDKKILYIGSGLVNECILPRCYGIDTYRYIKAFFDSFAPSAKVHSHVIYDAEKKEKILKSIENADVISFDIFDTLLQRHTLYPQDIFALAELRAKEEGLPAKEFAEQRIKAEGDVPGADIYGIYGRLQNKYHWDDRVRNRMLAIELETERMALHPRNEVVQLLQHAEKHRKKIILTSDMYLTSEILDDILRSNGINGYSQILVSCECGCSKADGLYEVLKERAASDGPQRRTLHIGDNPQVDGAACERYGIESAILPSSFSMAYEGKLKQSIECAETLMERCLIGMAVARVFRDPFRNPNLSEVDMEERLRRLASGVMGPLTAGYLTWLIANLKKINPDGTIFLARDGWILVRLYKELAERLPLPPAVYYYTNRHSSFLCCADDFSESARVIDIARQAGFTSVDILEKIYGLDASEIIPQGKHESVRDMVGKHFERIKEIAAASRDGYLKYSLNNGMKPGGTYVVSDFIAQGTTQSYLEQFLPFTLKGYYFGNHQTIPIKGADIRGYLKGENPGLLRNYVELESFFSSPEPAVDYMSPDGEPVFQEEVRSEREIAEMALVAEETVSFCRFFFSNFYIENEVIRPIIPEELYAADGFHWVQRNAYEDWFKTIIMKREWKQ